MDTLAWSLILAGSLLIRQVAKGRVKDIPGDTRDMFLAVVSGDTASVSEVATRTGTGITGAVAAIGSSESATVVGSFPDVQGSLEAEMRSLAKSANNTYILGTTGPMSYDCSGLVWRSLSKMGVYTGPRFTTSTFTQVAPKFASRVTAPSRGDIVLWPNHHMGIVVGTDRMYSALNHAVGIRESGISAESRRAGPPMYWRINA
jgi:cell wall-associated NlpC family hydrolase